MGVTVPAELSCSQGLTYRKEATTHFPGACPISWLRLADMDGRSLSHVANLGSLYWLRGPSSLMDVPSAFSTLPLSATHS